MYRPTLSTFRAQFPAEAMGVCIVDPAVANYCNEAQERLLMDPLAPDEGWWGTSATMAFSAVAVNGSLYITTPREVGRLIVMGVCQDPIRIRNGFYEYLKFGSGLKPKTCQGQGCGQAFEAYERDNVFTLHDLNPTPPKTIRIYLTDARDNGLRVLLQGKDANGKIVTTDDPGTGTTGLGEYIELKNPFADSLNLYTQITGIQKDETYGQIQFFQVDPATGAEVELSLMDPKEASANYRRYLVNGIPNVSSCCANNGSIQITAQARLDFIPVTNETDYLTLPNVPALIEESQSIRHSRVETANSIESSNLHHARALSLLNGQLDAYLGKTNVAVSVPIFGSQRMRRQPY